MTLSRRQVVHMAMGLFALALRFLTWWQAAACALAAFLFNLFVLPRIGGDVALSAGRPDARLPARDPVLPAVGPPADSRVPATARHRGSRVGHPRRRRLAGGGSRHRQPRARGCHGTRTRRSPVLSHSWSPAAWPVCSLALWTRPAVSPLPPLLFTLGAPVVAAIVAGLVESLPVRLDDNISVPIAAAIVLGGLALVDAASCRAAAEWLPRAFALALAVNVPVAAAGWLARTVTTSGAIAGARHRYRRLHVHRCRRVGAAVRVVPRRVGLVAARPQAEVGARHRRRARRAPRPGQRDREHEPGCVRGGPRGRCRPHREGALLAMVAALVAVRQRHGRERDRQGVGPRHIPVPDVGAACGPGRRARSRSRAPRPASSPPSAWRRSRSRWASCTATPSGTRWRARPPARSSRARSARRSRAPGILNNDVLNFLNTAIAAVVALALAWVMSRWLTAPTCPAPGASRPTSSSRGRSRCSRRRWGWRRAALPPSAPRRASRGAGGSSIYPLIGALMAAVLNAASNALNQIYDFEIDAVNKPKRPLPSGRMTFARGVELHHRGLRRRVGAGLARRARRPPRVLLARRGGDDHHLLVLGAAVPHQAARHLGQRDRRHPARRVAEGGRLVGGQDRRRRSSRGSSAPSSASSCWARRRRRTLPTWKATRAAAAARCPFSSASQRAAWMISPSFVVPFLMIPVGRVDRRPHRQLLAAAGARAS